MTTDDRQITFAALLRRARRAAGFTQEQLAERAGISTRSVSDLERGINRTPRPDTLDLLARALDIPADERRIWDRIRQRDYVRDASVNRTAPSATSPPSNLPLSLTVLVGRDTEVEQISRLVNSHRLVTLVGPGGTGKTRLALEIGHRMAGAFGDGVVWVDLSLLRDAHLVVPTIASAVGAQQFGAEPIEAMLSHAIGTRRLLLVTDNWEQVIDAAPAVGALLRACPNLHVLATSREALRISGEREIAILPLAVPNDDGAEHVRDTSAVLATPAVALFVERATAVRSDFAVSAENVQAIVSICRRVDGLPLAIELAAARVKALSPQDILQRLERPLAVLTGGARDLPARQQTVRNTIQWSYDLLSLDEQRLFQQLSVFVGGWSIDAAEAVVAGYGDIDVVAALISLIEKSLVVQQDESDRLLPYRMLAPIREFALEQLAAHGDMARLRQRHAEVMCELTERAYPSLRVFNEDWLDLVECELDNIRAALAWATESREWSVGLAISGYLTQFWFTRGYLAEGRRWADTFLEHDRQPTRLRARAALTSGMLAVAMDDLDAGAGALREALEIARSIDDPELIAEGLIFAAEIPSHRDPPDDAAVHALQAESLALIEDHHLDWLLVIWLVDASVHEQRMGRLDQAEALLTRQVAVASAQQWTPIQIWARVNLASVARARGAHADTRRHLREALQLNRSGRNRMIAVAALTDIAEDLITTGNLRAAVRLFALVDRERIRIWAGARGWADRDPRIALAELRDQLDPAVFEAELEVGRRMSLQEAIAFAVEGTDD